jgi:purine-binding chemotaxis protein CheW
MSDADEKSRNGESAVVQQYLSFRVADEDYAVPILQVQEIIGLTKTTVIPNTPPHVLGVVNLRGNVVPVLDLSQKFGMGPTQRSRTTVNIVVNVAQRTLGLVVDAVSDVVDLAAGSVQPPPAFDCTVDVSFLEGVAHADDRMLLILDLDRMIDFEAETGAAGEQSTEQATNSEPVAVD